MKIRFVIILTFLIMSFSSICIAKYKMKILIYMTLAQRKFFIEEIIKPFELKRDVKVTILYASDYDNIETMLKQYPDQISLIQVPFVKSWSLVLNEQLLPFNKILRKDDLEQLKNDYILTRFGQKKGYQFFLPRKYETRIMVYRKSKVEDAVTKWEVYKDTLNKQLSKINGFGLPFNYSLEDDPILWDYYDIFVVGFVWSQLPFDNIIMPRIAHRSKHYSGTAQRLIDRVYQCNGDSTSLMNLSSAPVLDAIEWEAIYAFANIYHPKMLIEEWSGKNIWEGFSNDEVFLSFMTQIDCFYLYGTGQNSMEGYIKDSYDIGISLMPTGCSPGLDLRGNILRKGSKCITTGGWWWAIPEKSPESLLAWSLFEHITSRKNQLKECTQFGMIPVRQDILKDKTIIYESGWISNVFQKSYQQIKINNLNFLPSHPRFDDISNLYLDIWRDIVLKRNWSSEDLNGEREYIEDEIRIEIVDGVESIVMVESNKTVKDSIEKVKTLNNDNSKTKRKNRNKEIIPTTKEYAPYREYIKKHLEKNHAPLLKTILNLNLKRKSM